jgi:hypothetical protein
MPNSSSQSQRKCVSSVNVLCTGKRGGVTAVGCNFCGVADTDVNALPHGLADIPIKPQTLERMLAMALRLLPRGAKLLRIEGWPATFKDD